MARPNDSFRRDQPDTQWLERMYNNRMRVPDHGDYFARWAAESALVRRTLAGELDVPYGDAPRERLDAFMAPRKGAPPSAATTLAATTARKPASSAFLMSAVSRWCTVPRRSP